MGRLFSTPVRAIVSTLVIISVIAVIIVCSAAAIKASALADSIGRTRAEEIAISDAGIAAAEIGTSRADFVFVDGRFVYEIAFTTSRARYNYTVNAADGTVLAKAEKVLSTD